MFVKSLAILQVVTLASAARVTPSLDFIKTDAEGEGIQEPMSGGAGSSLKILTLNVETYQTMCKFGVPDYVLQWSRKDGKYKTCGTCKTQENCLLDRTAKQCCAVKSLCSDGKEKYEDRVPGLVGCDHHGQNHFPGYINAEAGNLEEPLCRQGAREQLENVVLTSGADVIAVQEDLEFTPLNIPGYVSVVSPPSHPNAFKPDGGKFPDSLLEMADSKGKVVHIANSLLIRKELFDHDATMALCKGESGPLWPDSSSDTDHYRCGMGITSKDWMKIHDDIMEGKLGVQEPQDKSKAGFEDGFSRSTRKRDPEETMGKDWLFIAAPRVAALAVINFKGQQIALASAHLSGGRFDDALLLGDFAHQLPADMKEVPRMEKVHQVEKIVKHLNKKGMKGKSLIIGDYNGPDEFYFCWRNALLAPFVHAALATTFSEASFKDMKEELRKRDSTKDKELFGDDVKALSAILKPFIETSPDMRNYTSGRWVTDDAEAEDIIAKLRQFLKPWWTDMHESLGENGMRSLYKAEHFEHFEDPSMRGTSSIKEVNDQGGAFFRGAVVDYFYASKELLQNVREVPQPSKETGTEIVAFPRDSTESVSEGVQRYKAWLVPSVLGKITDHAPVLVCLSFGGDDECSPPGVLYSPDA